MKDLQFKIYEDPTIHKVKMVFVWISGYDIVASEIISPFSLLVAVTL